MSFLLFFLCCLSCADSGVAALLADEPSSPTASQSLSDRELYSRAASALLAKDVPLAARELAQLVAVHPHSPLAPLAALRLAECHLAEKKWNEAIDLLHQWLPELTKSTQARSLEPAALLKAQTLLARAYLHNGQYAQLDALCKSQLALYPDRTNLADGQVQALVQLESYMAGAQQKQEEAQAALLRDAAVKIKEKQFSLAQSALGQVDSSRLSNAWLWRYHVLRAQSELGQDRPAEALATLANIAVDRLAPPEQAAVRMIRLEAAVASGQLDQAQQELDSLQQHASNDPRQAPAIALRAVELAMLRKDRAGAEQLAQAAKVRFPRFESAHEFDLLLARNALARIEFDQARIILDSLLQSLPAHDPTAGPRAHWLLGESYLLSQHYLLAIEHYTAVIESQHISSWMESALMQRGKCYQQTGDTAGAIADYRRLVRQFVGSKLRNEALERLQQLGSPEAVELNSAAVENPSAKEASIPQPSLR